jgi:hypothetical protein
MLLRSITEVLDVRQRPHSRLVEILRPSQMVAALPPLAAPLQKHVLLSLLVPSAGREKLIFTGLDLSLLTFDWCCCRPVTDIYA